MIDRVFNVKLTAISEFDCEHTDSLPLTVFSAPDARFVVLPPLKLFPDAQFTFQNRTFPASDTWNYTWTFGDGYGSNDKDPEPHTYQTWGPVEDDFQYLITLTVANANCSSFYSDYLTLRPPQPIAYYNANEYESCSPLIVYFDNRSEYYFTDLDALAFEWDFGTTKPLFTFTPMDEDPTLPVELTSFAAIVNAQNLISLAWSTASETSMIGYKVYYRPANSNETTICLTPVAIPATNSSNGSNYNYTATELNTPGVYSFYLEAISMDGTSQFYGPVTATLSEIVIPPLPVNNNLGDAWPNPFNTLANTNISVEMKAGESGMVTIYNLAGQAVKSYMVTQGINNLNWNGLDSKGNACASGVYFYKLTSPSLNQTKKLMLLK